MTGQADALRAVIAAARAVVEAAHTHPACLRHAKSGAGGCVSDCPLCAVAVLSNKLIMLDRRETNHGR